MSRADTWYITPSGTMRVSPLEILVDEELKQNIDWNPYVGPKSTTVNSVAFSTENDSVATISNATLSSGVSTIEIGGNSEGRSTIKAAATLASGEVLVRKFMVTVIDPDHSSLSDYR